MKVASLIRNRARGWPALILSVGTVLLSLKPSVTALELGGPAPPIKVSEWIKGTPVALAKGSNVYVLDFWTTYAGNSIYTLPYLSNLQTNNRSRGVIIVGITTDAATKVKRFLTTVETPIEYRLAIDADQQTTKAYIDAVGATELPHAFVIDSQGRVVWHGNSTVALEKVLKEVLDGSFTLDSARRTIAAEKAMREYFTLATAGTNPVRMSELGEQVLANATGYASILNEFAWRILTDRRIQTRARDYPLALRASQEAFELSGGNEVPIMDTHARALFAAGKRAEAMEIEKKAIAACKDIRFRPELESQLMRFERLTREANARNNVRK